MPASFEVARHENGRTGHNTIDRRNILRTTYGLDCLTIHALSTPSQHFRGWIWHVFGSDIPGPVIDRLYDELVRRTFQDARAYDRGKDALAHPPVWLDADLARFARSTRGAGPFRGTRILGAYTPGAIYVDASLAQEALSDPDAALTLCAVLSEEFGHHVDHTLRNVYTDRAIYPDVATDAPLDEGAVFALAILPAADDGLKSVAFAYDVDDRPYLTPTVPGGFEWGLHFPEERIAADRRTRTADGDLLETFAAADIEKDASGHVHMYGHQGVEREAAGRLGWPDPKRRWVYFGNWQRDYSQVGDPKIIDGLRWVQDRGREVVQRFHLLGQDRSLIDGAGELVEGLAQLVCRPQQLREGQAGSLSQWRHPAQQFPSAWILPALVDVLAADHFGVGFAVPDSNLCSYEFGVYVPREHIDNPSSIDGDQRHLDTRFRGPYSHLVEGGVTTSPGPRLGMRNYIQQSVDYAKQQVRRAAGQPAPTPAFGLDAQKIQWMHFGNALHTLEDYFAHSNFAEICLKLRGHDVDTYSELFTVPPRLPVPAVVTGTFGGLDTAMSIIGILFHHLAAEEAKGVEIIPGPTTLNRLVLILLQRHCSPVAPIYAFVLSARDFTALPRNVREWIQEGFRTLLRFLRVQLAWTAAEVVLELIIPRFNRMCRGSAEQQRRAMQAADQRNVDVLIDTLMEIASLNAADRRLVRAASQLVDMDYRGDVGLHAHPRDPEKMAEILEELAGLYQKLATLGTNDPTHTQLGKDHGTHPLHLLAASLAIWAVTEVGGAMDRVWSGRGSVDDVDAVLDRIFRHPEYYAAADAGAIDSIVNGWIARNGPRVAALVRANHETPLALDSLEGKRRFLSNLYVLLKKLRELAR